MTDTSSFPVKAINGHDLSHHPAFSPPHSATHHQRFHAPVHELPEDDGLIACICGFADDDGWTVACDICNRWQHQSCYYPQYEEISLPPNVEHYCVDCKPRPVDHLRARARQLEKRERNEAIANGIKRSVPKSNKKKTVKESSVPYNNGWPAEKLRHDRNSASPRDQPPPAKRPKTSHRTSDSTTTITTKGHSRKRNASTAQQRRSVSRSPDSPIEQYSSNFLQCYMEDDWAVTDVNLHNSISITNALSAWLNLADEDFHAMHHQQKGDVLMRWDGDLDDIPGKAQIELQTQQDETVQYHGQHPQWKMVTVQEPVPTGAYLGELKGHIYFKKDYQDDSTNRWSELRHPEPFVFFHPKLPLVIDARHEGTDLRYVRRSCHPNARLQILVTGGVNYHFCFMALGDIEPGNEVAVSWDTNVGLPELALRSSVSDEDMEVLSGWVSTALANCGPCACGRPEGECMMSRFDRRARGELDDAQPAKAAKSKKRKAGQHISPLSTNALNSRSGSEARKVEADDDTDSRSGSGSRGPASRDITPNTHYSTNGASTLPELSERERKKLAKEEEMFRRQDEQRAGKQAKKKRNSAGSGLNTPSATSSKQLGFPERSTSKYVDAGTSRTTSQSSTKTAINRKTKASKPQSRPAVRTAKRSRLDYVDHDIQCDMDKDETQQRVPSPRSSRPIRPLRHRLLERCEWNVRKVISTAPPSPATKPKELTPDKMDLDTSSEKVKDALRDPSPIPVPFGDVDTEMTDVLEDQAARPSPTEATAAAPTPASDLVDATKPSQPDKPFPAPPWAVKSSASDRGSPAPPLKPTGMHVHMPPPQANPFGSSPRVLSAGTPGTAPGSIVQSPAALPPGPLLLPAVTAVVAASPARKKLSLSDYTRRKAKKDDESKADRESSPASVASGPIVPPLQPSSSTEAKAAEGTAIEEDVKMEEAPQAENVPPRKVA